MRTETAPPTSCAHEFAESDTLTGLCADQRSKTLRLLVSGGLPRGPTSQPVWGGSTDPCMSVEWRSAASARSLHLQKRPARQSGERSEP